MMQHIIVVRTNSVLHVTTGELLAEALKAQDWTYEKIGYTATFIEPDTEDCVTDLLNAIPPMRNDEDTMEALKRAVIDGTDSFERVARWGGWYGSSMLLHYFEKDEDL